MRSHVRSFVQRLKVIMVQNAILIVEDDDIFAAYLEAALTELGYAVLAPVATGEDAITRARADKPDLILMDVNLAGDMGGIEAARRIQSFADVPVIYLTSHAETSFLEKAKVTLPYAYLIKPVSKKGPCRSHRDRSLPPRPRREAQGE